MPDEDKPQERYRLLGVVPREIEQREEQEPDDTVFTWPHFLIRHVVIAALTIAVVFLLAILFDAPLKDIANPSLTPQEAKAPWYFAGLQELLAHLQPMVAGILIPGAAVLFLFALPYLDRSQGMADPGSEDGRDRVHRARRGRIGADRDRSLLPRARLVLRLAVAPPLSGAVAMTDDEKTNRTRRQHRRSIGATSSTRRGRCWASR